MLLSARTSGSTGARPNGISTVLQVVGAAAGIALVLYAVGGLLVAARLHALKLPAETVLGTYPKGELVASALHALAVGLGLGAAAGLLFWRFPSLFEHWYVRWPVAFLLLTIPMAVNELLQPLKVLPRLLTFAAWLIALVLATRVLTRHRRRSLSVFVVELFALIVVFGTTVGFVRAAQPPGKLNFVTVYLKDGDRTDGYLVVDTGDSVFFAPDVEEDTVGEIVSIPRDEVAHLSIDTRTQNVRPLGVTIGTPLIGRQPSLSSDASKRRNDVLQLAAEIRTDHRWRVPPVVPADSVDYLVDKKHYGQYVPTVPHRWIPGSRPQDVDALIGRSIIVGAFPFVVDGVVRQASAIRDHRYLRQHLVLGSMHDSAQLFCVFDSKRGARLRVKEHLEVEALPLAVGTMLSYGDKPTPTVWAVCSAVRSIAPKKPAKHHGKHKPFMPFRG